MLTTEEYAFMLRHDFVTFIERSFYELNPQASFLYAPYIEVLAAKLQACREGKIRRLIVALPPRSLKSHCVSIAFPAWLLGHDAAAHIICASYGQELADKLARDCRRLMQADFYRAVFPTRLSARTAVDDFTTTQQGTRLATSVGGVLTGRGADFIILDDPLKPDDALSEARRNGVHTWYDHSLISRLNDKARGRIILVMQRLHQDDLIGHVLEQEDWDVVSFPAIAEEDEMHLIESPLGHRLFRRHAGEPLHPARESLATLNAIRAAVGTYAFASQYQQNPIPVGGAMVKRDWLRFYSPADLPESFEQIVQSWDTANKASELNDFSVCTTWGVSGKLRYLLHVYKARLNYPELKRKVIGLADEYDATTILIEDHASGTQLLQDLAGLVLGLRPYEPVIRGDKIMRLHAQTAQFENGFVWLPRAAPWLDEYLREIISFPGSKHDDQVDSTTQALAHIGSSNFLDVWARLAS